MAIIRHVSRDNQVGIDGHRRCHLHGIFEIAHPHRERLPHAFRVAAGDSGEAKQVGYKLAACRVTFCDAKDVVGVRHGMPGNERASWRLLAPFYYSATVVNEGCAIQRHVQKDIGIDKNLQRL